LNQHQEKPANGALLFFIAELLPEITFLEGPAPSGPHQTYPPPKTHSLQKQKTGRRVYPAPGFVVRQFD